MISEQINAESHPSPVNEIFLLDSPVLQYLNLFPDGPSVGAASIPRPSKPSNYKKSLHHKADRSSVRSSSQARPVVGR